MTYEEYLALTEPSAAILVAMNAEIGAVIRAEIAERRYKRKLITIQKRNGKAILREFLRRRFGRKLNRSRQSPRSLARNEKALYQSEYAKLEILRWARHSIQLSLL